MYLLDFSQPKKCGSSSANDPERGPVIGLQQQGKANTDVGGDSGDVRRADAIVRYPRGAAFWIPMVEPVNRVRSSSRR